MTLGPVEYVVVEFPNGRFTGGIARELDALVRSGLVHVLDLVFITKGAGGDVVVLEVDELEQLAPFAALEGEVGGLISPEDVAHAASALGPGGSAALLIWEDLWAARFAEALRDAGGAVVEGGWIAAGAIEKALALLPPAGERVA